MFDKRRASARIARLVRLGQDPFVYYAAFPPNAVAAAFKDMIRIRIICNFQVSPVAFRSVHNANAALRIERICKKYMLYVNYFLIKILVRCFHFREYCLKTAKFPGKIERVVPEANHLGAEGAGD